MKASLIIKDNKEEILSRWIALVRENIPDANHREIPILKNNVPDLIDALVEALKSDDAREVVFRSETHGHERADKTNYSLHQVVREYRLLKQVIFSIIDDHGDAISTRERDGIMYTIDQAVEQSSKVFYEVKLEESKVAQQKADDLLDQMQEQGLMRDQFVAALSHDLKGPLNNSLQLIQLLEEHLVKDDPYINKILRGIRLSTLRSNELIENLLDVNLIQSGRSIPIVPDDSDLLQKVNDLVAELKPDLQQRVRIVSNQDKVINYWDAEALTRAVNNLVSNAMKYGDHLDITIRLEQNEKETVISVHNHGNPIPPKKLSRLFDLYYRTLEVKAEGWGLGLTLVKGVVEAHQGKVDVQSSAENGTTFLLSIPQRTKAG